jgi:imidazolonepropionase-like amidohydrolase
LHQERKPEWRRRPTPGNARILRLDDDLGTVEPGKLADFAVLDGDPLQDMAALRRVKMVAKEGQALHRDGM